MNNKIIKYNKEYFKNIMGLGLKINKEDMKPAQIILIQKSSDTKLMMDMQGKTPQAGQFFNTGKMKIYDSFKCNFIYVKSGTYQDRDGQEKKRFLAIGIDEDDSLFLMIFKGTYLYTLSKLFTAISSNQKPMFIFKCKMETKEITGDKGNWYIPVLRIEGEEEDEERIAMLEGLARQYDGLGVKETEAESKAEAEAEAVEGEDLPF